MGITGKILNILNKIGNKPISKPKLLIRLAFILIGFVGLIVAAQAWNSTQPIKEVVITGNTLIPCSEISKSIADTIINIPKNQIKYDVVKRNIASNPFISETYIKEGIHTLDIEVKERLPIALIKDEIGELCYVDCDAALLPYRLFKEHSDLPIISGVYNGLKVDSSALRGAIILINETKNQENQFLAKLISEIIYDRNLKEYIIYTSDSGLKIYIGSNSDLSDKLYKLESFWQTKLIGKNTTNLAYIDLRWNSQVIAKYNYPMSINIVNK